MSSSSERLKVISNSDFQQGLQLYAELTEPYIIRKAGFPLAQNLWQAKRDPSAVIERIKQTANPSFSKDHTICHNLAEFYRDTGDFIQMGRMLVQSKQKPNWYENFYIEVARKRKKFGDNPEPDLERVREYIVNESSQKFSKFANLATAFYEITGKLPEDLLSLAKSECFAYMNKQYAIDQKLGSDYANRPEYNQEIRAKNILPVANAFADCHQYDEALELFDMLDPTKVDRDDKFLRQEIITVKCHILFHLAHSCFKHGDYSQGFDFADQWFNLYKRITLDPDTDTLALYLKTNLAEALFKTGKKARSRTMLDKIREGIVNKGTSSSFGLISAYQEVLKKLRKQPDNSLYNLALVEVDQIDSDQSLKVLGGYELLNGENQGQIDLLDRLNGYHEIAEGFAKIGYFDSAHEALKRLDQFTDAEEEIKEHKIKIISFIALQEQIYNESFLTRLKNS